MLRLPQQIGGAQLCVHGVIGDDHRLGRACKKVNAHTAKKLALGLGHKGVAGAHQQMHRVNRFGAKCHRAHRLNAAQHVNLVRAAKMHRGDDTGVRLPLKGRGAGDDTRHARNGCRGDGHVRRGDHGKLAARNVAPDALHRDVLVAKDHAGQGLHLDIQHRIPLGLRKIPDLLLRKADVCHLARADLGDNLCNLCVAQAIAVPVIAVEPVGQFAHSRVAPGFDLPKGVLDDPGHFGIILGTIRLGLSTFEIFNCHRLHPDPGFGVGVKKIEVILI